MATATAAAACRFAAPLGLAPLPRHRPGATAAVNCGESTALPHYYCTAWPLCSSKNTIFLLLSGSKAPRSVAIKAANETSGGEGSTEVPEIVKAAQDAWAKVEDKYAVAIIGVAALVALWTAVGAVKAIDTLPILPGVFELVGIGYTGWFTYRNLIFQPDREALISKIKSTYDEITGTSS